MKLSVIFLILNTVVTFSQAVLDWSNYSSGNNNTSDVLFSTAIDLQGNCYVIGAQNQKMRVIKYSNAGFEAWAKEYSGNFPFYGAGSCIAVDKNNNLIAASYDVDSIQAYNTLLLKINKSTGDTIWSRHYHSSGLFSEYTRKMEIDTIGNIYIAADVSYTIYSDYLILKYSPDGTLLWTKTYSFSSKGVNFYDRIKDMKLDKNMNVYVFGYNTETTSDDSIRYNTVVKYNKDGVFQWAATYSISSPQSEIYPTSVDADVQGNVYISGSKHPSATTSGWGEFYIIKYNSSGIKQWTILYGGDAAEGFYGNPPNMKLDNTGNIILASVLRTSNGTDCRTFKYSAAGMLIWSNTSSLYDYNTPRTLEIKTSGEIYIGCVMFQNNIYKTGLFKLSSFGSTQWGVAYTGNGLKKELNDMKLFNNDIFIAGYEKLPSVFAQCLTLKFAEAEQRKQGSNENIPKYFQLSQNYPNPFNPVTMINYSLAKDSKVKITVFNILGMETIELVDEFRQAGQYSAEFDGSKLASGVYFYKIEAGSFTDVKKMILVK